MLASAAWFPAHCFGSGEGLALHTHSALPGKDAHWLSTYQVLSMDQLTLCRAGELLFFKWEATRCHVDEGKEGPGEGMCISAMGSEGADGEKST